MQKRAKSYTTTPPIPKRSLPAINMAAYQNFRMFISRTGLRVLPLIAPVQSPLPITAIILPANIAILRPYISDKGVIMKTPSTFPTQ